MLFLRERLNRLQWISLFLAGIGVTYLILQAASVPWLALGLAFSFGFYALLRKTVAVDSSTGFFMETLILLPAALIYFGYLLATNETKFFSGLSTSGLLALGGPLTALPLILYGTAVRLLPLSTMGFLQYLAPTLQFAVAVFLFKEPFDGVRLTAFGFIWAAVAIFIADAVRRRR
jgi:chloramphenicol-sensitive protein RarD